MLDFPPVTVIVLNLNGRDHLRPCLSSLGELDYPRDRLEVLLVDNGSRDDSVAVARREFPWVRVLPFRENQGFCRGINLGVREASTPFVAFLNNDTRVDPRWLAELVAPVVSGRADATGSRILSWEGDLVHFAGGGSNFHGIAFQVGMNGKDQAAFRKEGPTLFPCGAAMLLRKELFLEAGGFDEDFFAFYEDVDFGWRLWLLGHTVLYVPGSVVYHRHSATASRVGIQRLRVLHVRNPLYMIFKNYEEPNLRRVLPAALLLSLKRTAYLAGVPEEDFRIERMGEPRKDRGLLFRRNGAGREEASVPKVALADLIAYTDFARNLPALVRKREAIQTRRVRPDREILPLFVNPMWAVEEPEEYSALQEELVRFLGLADLFPPR
jgi:GT2 family glycosyltransferase